ncbi:MAG TPA: class I SAM-dependent methyltransferase [Lacipirellulaceae bacterium]|jgi:ubiquinone/menaquinone biosynthesis C-methylase UbiE|nr:class I SAM-dependent methyltransferase [Lacipirellulaceae bacterium]
MSEPSFARVKQTFEQRSMYDAVVEGGYMFHSELVSKLAAWAKEQSPPLRIVDLGCGDSWLATHAFAEANVAEYHGVDVSEASVADAQKRIAIWPGRASVVAGNMAEFLRSIASESATAILASYTIHHFSSNAKIALLADCFRVLVPGGTLIWIDAVRRPEDSREDYLQRLTQDMDRDWTALTPDQRAVACAHVLESDFPETATWMTQTTEAAGFECNTAILDTPYFRGWLFKKR